MKRKPEKTFRFYVDIGGKNLKDAKEHFQDHLEEEGINLFEYKENKNARH